MHDLLPEFPHQPDGVARPSNSAAPDLALLERWQRGWSLARGVALPRRQNGGLVVEVGWPDQLRRYLFVDAGAALQACALRSGAAPVQLKATVAPSQLHAALEAVAPGRWRLDAARTLMDCPRPQRRVAPAAGYRALITKEHGARVLRLFADGAATTQAEAASGRLVIDGRTAIFDRIETALAHRRRGLASAVMGLLDELAQAHGVEERLLVASDDGRALYQQLGWQVLAPYSTALPLDAAT